ncbi:protein of unknown function [Beijerinckiaceae bacterium RH AL1]|nr:hypothetical protein [Beijerinckiaceae bacterium]VVB44057.1 protein of unknown function [Beijerinckiaceae bacterium RH CH11]VVB44084.1 protein of unknown function [Beijerinckiaceae bacterium RH AL8]VVC54149.1 protein of unknown function [Beijerinckiaceae bacterium RH AL1]
MQDVVEPRHVAAFLSPFERDDAATSVLAEFASQLGMLTLLAGQPIMVPPELQPDFELARQRLLDEAV